MPGALSLEGDPSTRQESRVPPSAQDGLSSDGVPLGVPRRTCTTGKHTYRPWSHRLNPRKRALLFWVRGGICGICEEIIYERRWAVDHIRPFEEEGSHELSNLQPAHYLCNARKGGRRMEFILEETAAGWFWRFKTKADGVIATAARHFDTEAEARSAIASTKRTMRGATRAKVVRADDPE